MEFMTFLAAIGIVMSTFLLGFIVAGLHETEAESGMKAVTSLGLMPGAMLFVAICTGFILVEPALINPLWLQYTLLAALPLVTGYILRRVLAKKLENVQDQ